MAKFFSSKVKILSNTNSILHNVYILYFILLISLANLFYLVSANNYLYSSIFILVGFLTSFFSKNMMVILTIALVATNVLQYGRKSVLVDEGFETDKVKMVKEEDEDADDFEDVSNSSKKTAEMTDDVLDKYNQLLKLQEKITDGMKNIKEPLTEAESIVAQLAKTLGQPQIVGQPQ
jgi:hypothetical protein